jgi:antitoxin (DNA-binding transcriptional repressor) of toxin-antitoxin stability system
MGHNGQGVPQVGIRELRTSTTAILMRVCETGEPIAVTHRGRVIAHVVPPPTRPSAEEIAQALDRAHELMTEIGARVTLPVDASRLMRDERRW